MHLRCIAENEPAAIVFVVLVVAAAVVAAATAGMAKLPFLSAWCSRGCHSTAAATTHSAKEADESTSAARVPFEQAPEWAPDRLVFEVKPHWRRSHGLSRFSF